MAGSLKWLAGIGGKIFSFVAVMASPTGAHAMAQERLTAIKSNYGPKETMDRLEAEVTSKGLTVFALSLAGPQQASNPRMNQAGMKVLMDARMAVVKDALQLTPDQAKYRPAVEDAMRARAQARYARFTAVADQLAPGREVDPIALFRGRADAMAQRADELRKLVDAWVPLPRSLTPNQKEPMRLLAMAGVMPTLCPLIEGYPDCM